MRYAKIADRKNIYIYPWYVAELAHTKDMWKEFGQGVTESLFTLKNDVGTWYFEYESTSKTGQFLLEKIITDRRFLKKVLRSIYLLSENLLSFTGSAAKKKLENLTDAELISLYGDYVKRLRALRTWGAVPIFIDGLEVNYLSDRALSTLRDFLGPRADEASRIFSVLSSSEKPSEVQQEETARLRLILKLHSMRGSAAFLDAVANGKHLTATAATAKILGNHLREFGWLTYAYSGPPMGLADLEALMKSSLESKASIEAQLKESKERYGAIRMEKKAIIKEWKIPSDIQYIFEILSELMFIKDYRKGVYQRSYVDMDAVMEELARRLAMTQKEVKYLVYDEVSDALLHGRRDHYKQLLKDRLIECCYVTKGGVMTVYEGKACLDVLKTKLVDADEIDTEASTIKGTIAYHGKVRGTAKIVLVKEDTGKVQEGDILVSSSTNPDLIVAMKKAAGFVTDIGGIISHAAIVSRELKKPCVVGTRNASHIIRDGDIVELDANIGLVTILKRRQ